MNFKPAQLNEYAIAAMSGYMASADSEHRSSEAIAKISFDIAESMILEFHRRVEALAAA